MDILEGKVNKLMILKSVLISKSTQGPKVPIVEENTHVHECVCVW